MSLSTHNEFAGLARGRAVSHGPLPDWQDCSAALRTELLSAYLDQELPPTDLAKVEEALAGDADARLQLEGLREVAHNVRQLQKLVPSPGLDVVQMPRRAPFTPNRSLFGHLEERFVGLGRQTFLPLFALIALFVTGVWYFAVHLVATDTVDVIAPVEIPPEVPAAADTTTIGNRLFHRQKDLWVEHGLDPAASTRLVLTDTPEGQALLAAHPDLAATLALREVLLRVDGEIVHLRAPISTPPKSP